MPRSDTFRTLQDYPDTLPNVATPGAHRHITIDRKPLDSLSDPEQSPLVSLITVAFNSTSTIDHTIDSVQVQTYRNIEHIIIDGGSTDGTVEKIKSREETISYWHSCPDKGISDAFNAGVAVSRGHLVGIVNSDDWLSPNQIEKGVRTVLETGADFSYGDMALYSGSDILFVIKGHPDYERKIRYGMPPINHPSVLAKRTIYEDIGLFDLQWKIAMDYDWLYRCHRAGYRGAYTPEVCANMRDEGVSNTQFLQVYKESWRIVRKGGLSAFVAFPLFFFRYTKTSTRRLLELIIGKSRVKRLRIKINPRHESLSDQKFGP